MATPKHKLFVTCSRGSEPYLVKELTALGLGSHISSGFRGAFIDALPAGMSLMDAIFHVNYRSHLAMRVLLPLRSFEMREKMDLYEQVKQVNWRPYIPPGLKFAITAKVDHPDFRNTHYAAQFCKDAIVDQYRDKNLERPNVSTEDPDVQIQVFVNDGKGTINIDTTVLPLHMRGYRRESVEAPLRENLAAQLLHMASFPDLVKQYQEKGGERPLVLYDPMCGSGTILAEAALMATRTPAGFLREKWGFTHLPEFSVKQWDEFKRQQFLQRQPLPKQVIIIGTDIHPPAAHAAAQTLRRLCLNVVDDASKLHKSTREDIVGDALITSEDFRKWNPPDNLRPTLIMTNAPYGERLSNVTELRSLYRKLGDFMKQKTNKPATGWVLTEVGLQARRRHIVHNGGIECRLLEYDLF